MNTGDIDLLASSFNIPAQWSPFRLSDDQLAALEAVLAAFLPGHLDPWELREAAEATLDEHRRPAPTLVQVRTVRPATGNTHHQKADLLTSKGEEVACYVLPGLVRPHPDTAQANLVLGRLVEETDEAVVVELLSPTDQYTLSVHKLAVHSQHPPLPQLGPENAR